MATKCEKCSKTETKEYVVPEYNGDGKLHTYCDNHARRMGFCPNCRSFEGENPNWPKSACSVCG